MYDQFGRKINMKALAEVQRLEKLKSINQTNCWNVIDECIAIWKRTTPGAWHSYLVRLDTVRDTRRDKQFGQSRTGMYRYTLDIPQKIIYMIRCLYDDEELPMDKKFFHEFARRYPLFRIAEKN